MILVLDGHPSCNRTPIQSRSKHLLAFLILEASSNGAMGRWPLHDHRRIMLEQFINFDGQAPKTNVELI